MSYPLDEILLPMGAKEVKKVLVKGRLFRFKKKVKKDDGS